nr:MAG TPA: hypothetical protein [Caudoviricetes sp.]DAI21584.1 MAG TPA: hypothetical protein [Caudoviricetes sp.]DAT81992.1 MAG TPA: hypothetical protein [Caudoviricetes sp.]
MMFISVYEREVFIWQNVFGVMELENSNNLVIRRNMI